MGKIVVLKKRVRVHDEVGWRLTTHLLDYDRDGRRINFYCLKPSDVESFSGIVQRRGWLHVREEPLHLPEPVIEGLRRSLPHYLPDHTEDCYDFVNDVFGIERHHKEVGHRFWGIAPPEVHAEAGDAVFFLDLADDGFRHASIYIGNGLCISVNGLGGAVGIARLKDLKRDYLAKDVCVMKMVHEGAA